jgi:iron(III) transport system permease protein
MATIETLDQSPPARDAGISVWLNVNVRGWRLASLTIALMAATPILVVFGFWLQPAGDVWRHFAETALIELIGHTAVLVVGVGLGTLVLGTALAWLVGTCDFPGRRVFDWALMLPLAMPAYVFAFVYAGLLDYSGPVQTWWRGLGYTGFPSVRSGAGVVTVMVLAFYPYVYMLARAAFLAHGRTALETGRVFGLTPWRAFWRAALPMARPALATGAAIAVMEALADFGTVAIFNYDTFTTAIYKAWQGMFSLSAAAQLASLLLLFVGVALYAERRLRFGARYEMTLKPVREQSRYRLTGWCGWAVTGFALLVLLLAFVVPVGQLLAWAYQSAARDLDARYAGFLLHTLALAGIAALLTTLLALLLAYAYRLKPDRVTRSAVRFATLGYALPGSVLAVGIMVSFVSVDNALIDLTQNLFGRSAGPVLAGSVLALILAYAVRFLAVAHGPVDNGFERIRPSLWLAARSLGAGNWEIIRRVSLPLLRTSLLTAMLLVFVEVMKEMPATLLLRPFGWDTLATRIFEMTSEGEWQRAALPAVTLVLAGLIPVMLLMRRARAQ